MDQQKPSKTQSVRKSLKPKLNPFTTTKQNYGTPQKAKKLKQSGEIISERTVGKYMKQMGIKAQWTKPYTITTKDSDFSKKLRNILENNLIPNAPTLSGAPILPIFGQ